MQYCGNITQQDIDKHETFCHNFTNTKKAFKKLYMFYFETFRIILNPSSVRKIIRNVSK